MAPAFLFSKCDWCDFPWNSLIWLVAEHAAGLNVYYKNARKNRYFPLIHCVLSVFLWS